MASLAGENAAAADEPLFVFVGTYTKEGSRGIYLFEMDRESGKLAERRLAAEAENPSFIAVHPSGRFLYSVGEISNFEGSPAGAVSAFSFDSARGKLVLLNQQSSGGAGPCHVSLDPEGKVVLVANYGGGNVSTFPVNNDGSLGERGGFMQHAGSGPDEKRQQGPHAHSINTDASGRFALAADLGIDQVLIYRLNTSDGGLEPADPPAAALAGGAGPRHLAFHPNSRVLYVINELDSTITAFTFDPASGAISELQTISTLPAGFGGVNHPAEVLVHPSGEFLYGSNRGHDSLAIFAIGEDGRLKAIGHESTRGKNPRNFGIDPSGRFLIVANQDSNSVVSFRVDPDSGRLMATGDVHEVSMPVCVRFR